MWNGKIGGGENPTKEVWIHINEPKWWGILLQGSKVGIDMWHNHTLLLLITGQRRERICN
jgi:hypothetical protein